MRILIAEDDQVLADGLLRSREASCAWAYCRWIGSVPKIS